MLIPASGPARSLPTATSSPTRQRRSRSASASPLLREPGFDQVEDLEAVLAQQPDPVSVREVVLDTLVPSADHSNRCMPNWGRSSRSSALPSSGEQRMRSVELRRNDELPSGTEQPRGLGDPLVRVGPDRRSVLRHRDVERRVRQRHILAECPDELETRSRSSPYSAAPSPAARAWDRRRRRAARHAASARRRSRRCRSRARPRLSRTRPEGRGLPTRARPRSPSRSRPWPMPPRRARRCNPYLPASRLRRCARSYFPRHPQVLCGPLPRPLVRDVIPVSRGRPFRRTELDQRFDGEAVCSRRRIQSPSFSSYVAAPLPSGAMASRK